ncbi:MAG: hypothetical protein ACI88L_000491 [Candidatus Paceibacteria bacterium]|jgi:hypothetical protein
MCNKTDVLNSQVSLIKEASLLLKSRIKEIENLTVPEDKDLVVDAALRVFKVRSINAFVRTLDYLCGVIDSGDEAAFYNFLNSRILFDIYSRFLYLEDKYTNDDERVLPCMGLQLYTASKIDDSGYNLMLIDYEELFLKKGIDLPQNPKELSKRKLRKFGMFFPLISDILTTEKMKEFMRETVGVINPKSTYAIYSHLSELLHGNPYYHDSPHNEIFWTIGLTMSNSLLLIDLIDSYTIKKIGRPDFRELIKKYKEEEKNFIPLWKKNMLV